MGSEQRGVRPVGAVWNTAAPSEPEGSAADEDHDAEADENDGKEDALPAFEHFRDRGGRVATNFARATKTATSARKITQ